jgi:hypothetical protein
MSTTTEYIRLRACKTPRHALNKLQHDTWLNRPKDDDATWGQILDDD